VNTLTARAQRRPSWRLVAVALALLGLTWWVAQGAPTDTAPAQWQRPVMFDQAADGSVLAIEPSTGEVLRRWQGEQGFVRGVVRTMARARLAHGLPPGGPYQLIGRQGSRLQLADAATDTRIDLESFGPSNWVEFAALAPQSAGEYR